MTDPNMIQNVEVQMANMTVKEFVQMTTAWGYGPELTGKLAMLVCRPKNFTVKCVGFGPTETRQKIQAIKEFRYLTGLPLKESKDWADGNSTHTFSTFDEVQKLNLVLKLTGYEAVNV